MQIVITLYTREKRSLLSICSRLIGTSLRRMMVPCTPGTPAYKLQVKTRSKACIHALPRVLRPQTSPPYLGGLWCYHVSHGPGPQLLAEMRSGTATCPSALDLTSQPRWTPVLPRYAHALPRLLQDVHADNIIITYKTYGHATTVWLNSAVSCGYPLTGTIGRGCDPIGVTGRDITHAIEDIISYS
jgi:hypothetical protein